MVLCGVQNENAKPTTVDEYLLASQRTSGGPLICSGDSTYGNQAPQYSNPQPYLNLQRLAHKSFLVTAETYSHLLTDAETDAVNDVNKLFTEHPVGV